MSGGGGGGGGGMPMGGGGGMPMGGGGMPSMGGGGGGGGGMAMGGTGAGTGAHHASSTGAAHGATGAVATVQHGQAQIVHAGSPALVHSGSSSHSLDTTGLNLIKSFEGWKACYYKDVAGYPTIGYGHLIKSGDGFGPSSCITQSQGEALLMRDAQTAVNCVNAMGVSLNQHQFDALVSFAFNLGCGTLSAVKPVIEKGNAAVCAKIEQYTHAGGKVVSGLVTRRREECQLYSN